MLNAMRPECCYLIDEAFEKFWKYYLSSIARKSVTTVSTPILFNSDNSWNIVRLPLELPTPFLLKERASVGDVAALGLLVVLLGFVSLVPLWKPGGRGFPAEPVSLAGLGVCSIHLTCILQKCQNHCMRNRTRKLIPTRLHHLIEMT